MCDVVASAKWKITKKKLDFAVDANLEDLVTVSSTTAKEANPVIDLKFDPHSDSYLLIAYKNGISMRGKDDLLYMKGDYYSAIPVPTG